MSKRTFKPESESSYHPKQYRGLKRIGTGIALAATLGAGATLVGQDKLIVAQSRVIDHEKQALDAQKKQLAANDARLRRLSSIVANLNNLTPSEVSGQGLRNLSQLPGYEKLVSPELRTKLEASMV